MAIFKSMMDFFINWIAPIMVTTLWGLGIVIFIYLIRYLMKQKGDD